MSKTLKHFALWLALLGLALIHSTSLAQVRLAPKLPGARAAAHPAQTSGSPSYTYTLLSFPGNLSTLATGINLGATTSRTQIVGGVGPDGLQGGFLVDVSAKSAVTETYQAVNHPHVAQQYAESVNDSGQIVGVYMDSSDVYHGYERSGGKYTTLDVPFTGATGTFPEGINNSGEVVGGWESGDLSHGFTLIGGTYASFDYPGATQTFAYSANNEGEIVGYYVDTSGVSHGFLLSGGTYTSVDVPSAVGTFAIGINDAGNIVGAYCLTSECLSTSDGEQGFLLSGGVFTTIAIPGESRTAVAGINNNGVVVGFYQDAAGLVVAFVATP
jgi:uncharacterized membrane protein